MSKRHQRQQCETQSNQGTSREQGGGQVGGVEEGKVQEHARDEKTTVEAREGGALAAEQPSEVGAGSAAAAQEASAAVVDELAQARAQAEEWKNKYLYALAEIDNMRKRAQRERSELLQFAGQQVLYDLLEVADNFARAIEADRAQSDPKVIVEGIELIYKQLMQVLEKHHVRPIAAAGTKFDPSVHEALQQVPTAEAEPGTVIAELQRGYMLRDRVLRPARVVVAAPPESEERKEESKEAKKGEGETELSESGTGSEAK